MKTWSELLNAAQRHFWRELNDNKERVAERIFRDEKYRAKLASVAVEILDAIEAKEALEARDGSQIGSTFDPHHGVGE